MRTLSENSDRYDRTTIVFHWLTAALVAFQWLGAQTIDWFPRGGLRVDARSVHIVVGVILGTLLLIRIFWRMTGGRKLPSADGGFMGGVATATHWALYALLATMVLVGLFLAWTRGDNLFNLMSIPAWAPGDRKIADQVQDIHALIGWFIVGLVGLHSGAALFHRIIWSDGVLGRMVPTRAGRERI